jgi:hypothetical protein
VAETPPRKPIPFHPPLFAAFPVLSIYSANLALIPLSDLWVPLITVVGLSFPIWAICGLIARSWSRGASAASLICSTLVFYSPISRAIPLFSTLSVWFGCVALLGVAMGFLLKNPTFLNIMSSLMVAASLGGIAWGNIHADSDLSKVAFTTPAGSTETGGHLPDIFYIILDGYGREDALKRVMHFDNSGFIDALKKRGFYVADKSHSNYVQTELSISSSLNFNLIPNLLPHMSSNSSDRKPLDALISNSAASRFLTGRGYRTISITSGFPPLKFPFSDLWLTQAATTSLFETTLLQMSPFVNRDQVTESQFIWRRSAILGALENTRRLAVESPRPRFVFVHVLAPHPPFVFGPHGELVRHHGPYGFWDGSDYMTYAGNRETYRNGYVNQVQYLNSQVLLTVDALLSSKEKPIILIQGDHGSKMKLDQDDLAKTDVTECFENLSTFYVPENVRKRLYPTITPVNSFRILLSSLFGAKLPLMPDKSWYSPYSKPYQFTDVTAEVVELQADVVSWVRGALFDRSWRNV